MRALTIPLLLALGACVSPRPEAELASAMGTLGQARPIAGPYAPAELQAAQAKLGRASEAMAREDWTEARRLAEQAELDARFALAIAENERSRRGLAGGAP